MTIPAGARYRRATSVEFWRVGDQLFGRQIESTAAGSLTGAVDAIEALEELAGGDRLPLLFDASTAGWMAADARAYSRERIGRYLTRAAVVVSWEKRQAHGYAFADVHRDSGVEVAIFTDYESARRFLLADSTG